MKLKIFFNLLCLLLYVSLSDSRQSPNGYLIEKYIKENDFKHKYSEDLLEDAILDAPSLIRKYNYPLEIHKVFTDDDYILEIHRIPFGKNVEDVTKKGPVVFLLHGLTGSSAQFMLQGPENALAFVLADAGYDVWLGNFRGNYYSRQHIRRNPDSMFNLDFWRFSIDELGYYDLPAMIDFILERSKRKKMHFIGHSNGASAFYVLCSLKPEYNEKFITFHSLAGTVTHENSEYNSMLTAFPGIIESIFYGLGAGEIKADPENYKYLGYNTCDENSILQFLCLPLLFDQSEYLNSPISPVILGHSPAGSSIRQLFHNLQMVSSGKIRRYDYGLLNIYHYGTWSAPEYNLTKITVPTYLHYGMGDKQVNFKDVLRTAELLPNVVGTYKVENELFEHNDFLYSLDAKHLVYDKIIQLIKEVKKEKKDVNT